MSVRQLALARPPLLRQSAFMIARGRRKIQIYEQQTQKNPKPFLLAATHTYDVSTISLCLLFVVLSDKHIIVMPASIALLYQVLMVMLKI
jgi:hypothetical protein